MLLPTYFHQTCYFAWTFQNFSWSTFNQSATHNMPTLISILPLFLKSSLIYPISACITIGHSLSASFGIHLLVKRQFYWKYWQHISVFSGRGNTLQISLDISCENYCLNISCENYYLNISCENYCLNISCENYYLTISCENIISTSHVRIFISTSHMRILSQRLMWEFLSQHLMWELFSFLLGISYKIVCVYVCLFLIYLLQAWTPSYCTLPMDFWPTISHSHGNRSTTLMASS